MSRASGIGSWPGTSVPEALAVVRDVLSEDGLPYLPELPARGPGSDMVGRAAGLLVDLAVDLQPMGWRFVDRPGRDALAHRLALAGGPRRAGRGLRRLHRRAEAAGAPGRGPWPRRCGCTAPERAVVDARAPPATSSPPWRRACGATSARSSAWCRAPRLVLQLDEPGLPAVLAGRLPTASGYGVLRAVDPQVSGSRAFATCSPPRTGGVRRSTAAPGPELAPAAGHRRLRARGRHHAARPPRVGVGRGDGGVRVALWAGVLPTDGSQTSVSGVLGPLVDRWREVGLPVAGLDAVTVTPTCGLAGLTPEQARGVQEMAADTARALTETAGS